MSAPDVAGGEDDDLPVGRERVVLAAAERLRRAVRVHRGHQVEGLALLDVVREEVVARAVLPGVPVPVQEMLYHPRLDRIGLALPRDLVGGQQFDQELGLRGHRDHLDVGEPRGGAVKPVEQQQPR